MLYGRPDGPRLIPKVGVFLYRMKLIQMSNEELERELRYGGTQYGYRTALLKEIRARQLEGGPPTP